jgi:hypothetical protein
MSVELLEALKGDDIQARAGVISGPVALRDFFESRDEVRQLALALKSGSIDETTLRGFVAGLLQDLQTGVLFPHDLTLAALAVAIEDWDVPFAEEYLSGLAGLKSAEMPYGPRIAGEMLSRRLSPPHPVSSSR